MKILKKGFTIAEMLICFTVIGILASMLIPSIINNRPNKNMAMVRKAYQITERAVAELISDEDNFPSDGATSVSLAYYDPDDQKNNPNSDTARTQQNTGKFFCSQFAAKLSTNDLVECDSTKTFADKPSFTTNDGIHWYIDSSIQICDPGDITINNPDDDDAACKFPDKEIPDCPAGASKSPFICVHYDVNGDELPNLMVSTAADSDTPRADRGWFYVYWNGKVVAPKGQTERYLNSTDAFNNKYLKPKDESKTD